MARSRKTRSPRRRSPRRSRKTRRSYKKSRKSRSRKSRSRKSRRLLPKCLRRSPAPGYVYDGSGYDIIKRKREHFYFYKKGPCRNA